MIERIIEFSIRNRSSADLGLRADRGGRFTPC